ncbi:MAG: alanine racemase, partial [Acidobacteriota bacterium]
MSDTPVFTPKPAPPPEPAPGRAAPETLHLNSWIEIDAAAYRHNVRFLRDAVGPDVELAAVVKSNAYGHG